MGDGMVLNRVMRRLHRRFPTVPWLVVGKEISVEDVRLTLDKLPERLFEHPQMVVAVTNMYYSEAPALRPRSPSEEAVWIEHALEGGSTEESSRPRSPASCRGSRRSGGYAPAPPPAIPCASVRR